MASGVLSAGGPGRGAILSLLVVVLFAASPLGSFTSSASHASGTSPTVTEMSHPGAVSGPARAPTPASSPPASSFFHLTSDIAAQPAGSVYCSFSSTSSPSSLTRYCFPQAQNPSALHLANGNIAVAYSILTNSTTSTCPAAATQSNSRVGFSVSADGGLTFGVITYLGNNTCPFVNAIEPSFGVSNAGPIYGTFVEENFSNGSNAFDPGLPPEYGNRTSDALGFVSSTDNGSSFSAVTTILSGSDIARPELATFGATIYIVYTDTQNGTIHLGQAPNIPRPDPLPTSVRMLVSTDRGSTWSGPTTLPGENVTESYTAFGASIAVNSGGGLAVAYATNRSCLQSFGCSSSFGWEYGESVVVVTSTNNGSGWNGPTTVGPQTAEEGCYGYDNGSAATYFYPDPCLSYLFELTPQTSITFGASGTTIYVAWSGGHSPYYLTEDAVVWAAISIDGGASWNSTLVAVPSALTSYYSDEYSTPALGYSNGTVYLAYLEKNGTSCFISIYCSLLLSSYSEWVTSSPDGLNWSAPSFVTVETSTSYTPHWIDSFSGFTDSLAFNAAGHPVVAFGLNQRPFSSTTAIGNTTFTSFEFGTVLDVAVRSEGANVTLTLQVNGNPTANPWSFSVDGQTYSAPGTTSSVVVAGVPAAQSVRIVGPTSIVTGYAHELGFEPSVPELSTFGANSTVYFNATNDYGITFSYQPPQAPGFCMCLMLNGAYYIYIPLGFGSFVAQPSFPWYFPAGTQLLIAPQINQGSFPTLYYVGTGNGSHTGPGTWANVTVNGPINETVWNGLLGKSSLAVSETGLPGGTSFTFLVDGVAQTGVAGSTSYVSNLLVGPHSVSGAQAPGTGGFEWFGSASPSHPVVPYQSNVTLTFADVNTSSSLGVVSFEESGILSGAAWSISFNGSLYSSTTAWNNVTSRSGTFPFATYAVGLVSGTAGFAPTTTGPTVDVSSGSTVPVNYTAAYEVRVAAGVGGTVTGPLTQWVAPGAVVALAATAQPGYNFLGWAGGGNGSYTGPLLTTNVTVHGPVAESAGFQPLPGARFNLTFTESGVPSGSWWSVELSGVSYGTNTPNLRIPDLYSCSGGARGLYAVAVPYATDASTDGIRYVPSTVNGTVCTTGATLVAVQYTSQYLVNTTANLPSASVSATCNLQVGTALWCPASGSVGLSASAVAGETFVGWVGTGPASYTGSVPNAQFVPSGPVAELAQYSPSGPASTYSLTLTASPGFAAGTAWIVAAGGHSYSSTGSQLVVPGLASGTVTVTPAVATSPDGGSQYTPAATTVSVPISANASKTLLYHVSYAGTISAGTGGTVGPSTGWFAANSTVQLSAIPDSGETFVAWSSTGAGYSGSDPNGSFPASGRFAEVGTFAPVASATSTTVAGTSLWSSPVLWVALALVGLVVGLAAGVMVTRRGQPPAESAAPPSDVYTGQPPTGALDGSTAEEEA